MSTAPPHFEERAFGSSLDLGARPNERINLFAGSKQSSKCSEHKTQVRNAEADDDLDGGSHSALVLFTALTHAV